MAGELNGLNRPNCPKEGYPDSDIDDMRVIVLPNGEVETAYPLSGPAVKRWVPELNDGEGGFVDTA